MGYGLTYFSITVCTDPFTSPKLELFPSLICRPSYNKHYSHIIIHVGGKNKRKKKSSKKKSGKSVAKSSANTQSDDDDDSSIAQRDEQQAQDSDSRSQSSSSRAISREESRAVQNENVKSGDEDSASPDR